MVHSIPYPQYIPCYKLQYKHPIAQSLQTILRTNTDLSLGHHAVCQAKREGLLGVDGAAGQDQVQGPAKAHDCLQTYGAAVDERNTKAAAEDA